MAAVLESPTGKRKVLLKLSTLLCWYRPSLTVQLAIELYLLPCERKRAARLPGSIAIASACRSSQSFFLVTYAKDSYIVIVGAL